MIEKRMIHMYKFVLIVSCIWITFILAFASEGEYVYAIEEQSKLEKALEVLLRTSESCTERCHVNYMAYENKFEATRRAEIFRHKTHSFEQNLECTSCHDNSEVNTKKHGKLTIKKDNCLKCHHVELKESECKRCHNSIDENPMEYKEEKFIHGFTVKDDVDCELCHIKDPNASLKNEEINCVKCHHTTPDLSCAKCHKDDVGQHLDTVPEKRSSLSWTVSFRHSQHPEKKLSCKECHSVSHENDAGIAEYNLNCSKCHHVSKQKEKIECAECHKEPLAYLRGEMEIKEIAPIPDMMSRAVKCEDCHKYNDEKLKFRGVEEYCIECHNEDYGKLYNAWIRTIEDRLEKFNRRVQNLVEGSDVALLNESNIDVELNEEAGGLSNLETFLEKTGNTIDLITKYGTHNFNLTRTILDHLEEKIK